MISISFSRKGRGCTRKNGGGSSRLKRRIAGSCCFSALAWYWSEVHELTRTYPSPPTPPHQPRPIPTLYISTFPAGSKEREEEKREEGGEEADVPIPGPSLYLSTPTSKLSSPPPSLNIDFNLNCRSNPMGGKRGVPMCFLFAIWDNVLATRPGGSSGPLGCFVVFLGCVGGRGLVVNGILFDYM